MGTDIHYSFQKKTMVDDREVWETISDDNDYDDKFHIGRDYVLFSVLADVRNGTGFAGFRTYDPLIPIAEPRGLPEDLGYDEYGESSDTNDRWYGDHSLSYLSDREILNYFDMPHQTTEYGVVSKNSYLEWDGTSSPDSWSTFVSGDNVLIYDATEEGSGVTLDDTISHVSIKWNVDINQRLSYFKSIVEYLVREHGDLRMVFGFDS